MLTLNTCHSTSRKSTPAGRGGLMKGMGLFSSAIRGEAHPVKIIKNNKKTLFMPVYGKSRIRASYLAVFRSLLTLAHTSYLAFFRSLLVLAYASYLAFFYSPISRHLSETLPLKALCLVSPVGELFNIQIASPGSSTIDSSSQPKSAS